MIEGFIESNIKFKVGSLDQLAHCGLIKILVEEALHTFTLPIAWEVIKNMTVEGDIKVITYDINPFDSEEEEQKGGEYEATDDSAGQEKEKEETKIEEEKDEGTEQEEIEQIKKEKVIEGGEKEEAEAKQRKGSPENLKREAAAGLTILSTPTKPKEREKGRPPCILRP